MYFTKRIISTIFIVLCAAANLAAQISVTSPDSGNVIKSPDEYAALSFQNHIDMDNRLDLGWWLHVNDQPLSYLSNITFSGGMFTATTNGTDPNISILDTGVPGTCFLGKIGTNFPINAGKYRILMFRMKLDSSSMGQVIWSQNTIFSGVSISNAFYTYGDWNIYTVDLVNLGAAIGSSWSGTVDSLRLDPTVKSGEEIKIDWIRLVELDPALFRTITWTGDSGGVDIYLDSDKNSSNGNLGRIAANVSGGSYSFYAGGLPYGTYYVGIRAAGTQGTLAYSSGYYTVNDIPVLKFLSPSEEGSADDFATAQLNNAWDMNSTNDIDYTRNLTQMQITTVDAEDDAGNPLGTISAFRGLSAPAEQGNVGDPGLYTLWWTDRGETYHIDSDRYRILVLEMGLPGQRNLVDGSEARIIWKVFGESQENVSQDVVIRSKSGTLVMNKIIADMKAIPNESDPGGSPSLSGWTGQIDNFRIDPHEFSDPKEFYVKNIKLAAFEKTSDSYLFEWDYNDTYCSSSTLALYYDSNGSGFNGTLIVSGVNPAAGQYRWDVSGMADGTYYIYAVYSDGLNSNRCYAKWPIIVEQGHQIKPSMTLNRDRLNFGILNNGVTLTSPQSVSVNIQGTGSVNWQVQSSQDFILVSPASGSGNGKFTVSIDPRPYWVGEYSGVITVTSPDVENSPQYVNVSMRAYSVTGSLAPIGYWDTPQNGTSQIRGQIPVTGWALDDIEVDRVEIWRRPEPEDSPESISPDGLIFVGDALFVEGARPNLETDPPYNQYPYSYKGGWGYMMLTYGLPRQGNGSYLLYAFAFDKEGKKTSLGTKSISCDNVNAVKPFGTIDTPAPGMTFPHQTYGNINFGWVLTPMPKYIPYDGSTIFVYIDGVCQGILSEYGNYSASVAEMFPGYANAGGSYGHYLIDLGAFENGVHTIQWTAYDNEGVGDGIGSRYFTIENASGGSPYKTLSSSDLAAIPENYWTPVRAKNGYHKETAPEIINPDHMGRLSMAIRETGRVEIHLGEQELKSCRGYMVVGDQLKSLPIGSTLDKNTGTFYWQAGPGFVGEYRFVFVREFYGRKDKINIIVNILPRFN